MDLSIESKCKYKNLKNLFRNSGIINDIFYIILFYFLMFGIYAHEIMGKSLPYSG
jgi:hypothetical protein